MELRCGAKTQNCPEVRSSTRYEFCGSGWLGTECHLVSFVFIRIENSSLRLDHFPGEGAFLQPSQEVHCEIKTGSRDSTFYRLLHMSSTKDYELSVKLSTHHTRVKEFQKF